MFGRAPFHLIDQLFNTPQSSKARTTHEEWIKQHRINMQNSYELAFRRIEQKAKQRKTKHDQKAKDCNLDIGSLVFLRNRVKGRNKIQDTWDSTSYKVLSRIDGGNAYIVQKDGDDSSKHRTVNRVDLLSVPFSDSETESSTGDDTSDSSSSTDSENDFSFQVDPNHRTLPEPEPQQTTSKRVSRRANKGRHTNPHNLPRSVLDRSQFVDDNPYRDLTQTISRIGESNVHVGESNVHLAKLLQLVYSEQHHY